MWGGSPEPLGAQRRAFLCLNSRTSILQRKCPLRGQQAALESRPT